VKNKAGLIEFDGRLDRGMMRERTQRCTLESDGRTRTPITISFTINDGVNLPINALFTRKWECPQPERYHLRARESSHRRGAPAGPPPASRAPPTAVV
jgi:hypothetical protein